MGLFFSHPHSGLGQITLLSFLTLVGQFSLSYFSPTGDAVLRGSWSMCRVSVPASIPHEASFPGFAGTEIQAHSFPRLDTVSASHTSTMVTRSLFI